MYKTVLKIDGMMCSMCESHVNDSIRKEFNVKKVNSSHKKGETVVISKDKLEEQALKQAIESTGYKVLSFDSQVYEKKGLFGR